MTERQLSLRESRWGFAVFSNLGGAEGTKLTKWTRDREDAERSLRWLTESLGREAQAKKAAAHVQLHALLDAEYGEDVPEAETTGVLAGHYADGRGHTQPAETCRCQADHQEAVR